MKWKPKKWLVPTKGIIAGGFITIGGKPINYVIYKKRGKTPVQIKRAMKKRLEKDVKRGAFIGSSSDGYHWWRADLCDFDGNLFPHIK